MAGFWRRPGRWRIDPLSSFARMIGPREYNMAGARGFEPLNARIKTWCLAAWRRPNKSTWFTG